MPPTLPGPMRVNPAHWTWLTLFLLILALVWGPSYASASELPGPLTDDHNFRRIDSSAGDVDWGDQHDLLIPSPVEQSAMYEPDFAASGVGREILGRAAPEIMSLKNNEPDTRNLEPGQTVYYVFEKATIAGAGSNRSVEVPPGVWPGFGLSRRDLEVEKEVRTSQRLPDSPNSHFELQKRQAANGKPVYITANTCMQPTANGTGASAPMSQLTMYISTQNEKPGPGQGDRFPFLNGFGNVTFNATRDQNVFIAITAPNTTTSTGTWNFAIAASVDGSFFSKAVDFDGAWVVDTDQTSALIVTNNLTDPQLLVNNSNLRTEWLARTPPFSLFVVPKNSTGMASLNQSYCGLSQLMKPGFRINTTITTRNQGNNPKQQFHVEGLEPGTEYMAVLAYRGENATENMVAGAIGGGGRVWKPFGFKTKTDANCKLIYNLPFCSDVAYSVPTNATASREDLIGFYDSNAKDLFRNFNYSLQQIPCNTTSSAQYSLVRNCTDCDRDYRSWLCAVTIPRCDDFSLPAAGYTMPRNVGRDFINGTKVNLAAVKLNDTVLKQPWTNSSRFGPVDEVIKPGPYREMLPCINLCYELVKSCPASMGFACPTQQFLRDRSYGEEDMKGSKCNWVGVDQPLRSEGLGLRVGVTAMATAMSILWMMF